MTTDQKMDEVLKLVREHGERSEARDNELLSLILEERTLNNTRFSQLTAGVDDVRKEVRGLKVEMNQMDVRLNTKIDKVYDSLSQDIQIFAEDLHHVKRRVTRLEKKFVS